MANEKIREEAKRLNVRLWEIAYEIGVTDSTFSRRLRRELSPEETTAILEITRNIARKHTEAYSTLLGRQSNE